MRIRLKLFFLIIAFCNFHLVVKAQQAQPFSCLNAEEILFPLDRNDFSASAVLMNDMQINAVYYLYQDRYSFWYKLVATEDAEISFSVSPTNREDRYQSLAFKTNDPDFCVKLVNQEVHPYTLDRRPILLSDSSVVYRNVAFLQKGDTLLVSVLSLNRDDCGHQLYIESENQNLTINAIHRPCYNVKSITDVPDYDVALKYQENVELVIEDILNSAKPAAADTSKPGEQEADPFLSLKTIEIVNAEQGEISVGDRLILNRVFFYTNTYALKPEATGELEELVVFLKQNPGIKIEIQGHTANDTEDITPDPNYKNLGPEWNFKGSSMKLSEARAKKVKDFLIEQGIKKSRLKTRGFGDTRKRVEDAKTFEEFEKNMRVEVLILQK